MNGSAPPIEGDCTPAPRAGRSSAPYRPPTGGASRALLLASALYVLRVVAELCSQYLLVYGLDGDDAGLGPRSVEVEVRRAGLEVRNIHSHYQ